jgi:predicted small secreted protein
MNRSDGIKWCKNVKGKYIKITGTRDEFLLTSKALEIYKAGIVVPNMGECIQVNLLIIDRTGES